MTGHEVSAGAAAAHPGWARTWRSFRTAHGRYDYEWVDPADPRDCEVKLIYIDPPFNTEQTFEHYADQLEQSIWLTMMRDRLLLMKVLLSPGGSIWVHLDGAEAHRMRSLLDEVLGPENFITTTWLPSFDRSPSA